MNIHGQKEAMTNGLKKTVVLSLFGVTKSKFLQCI